MIYRRSIIKVVISTLVALALVTLLWFQSTTQVEEKIIPSPSEDAAKPVPDFTEFTSVSDKKKAFFSYLKPEVIKQNQHILGLRHQLLMFERDVLANKRLNDTQMKQLTKLAKEYRVIDTSESIDAEALGSVIKELLIKVDILPVDLVLVQGANESAWGTSRFAQEGYNFFGMWCFKKGCGFVPKRRNDDASHEVAKYRNLTQGVYSYMRNLNRHQAYADLRKIRANLRAENEPITGSALAEGLLSYSERGHEYVEELQSMIRFNKEYFGE